MSDETPKPDGRGKSPGSLGALRPPKEGEPPRNPKGVNGWDTRRQAMVDWLDGKSASLDKTRIEQVRPLSLTAIESRRGRATPPRRAAPASSIQCYASLPIRGSALPAEPS